MDTVTMFLKRQWQFAMLTGLAIAIIPLLSFVKCKGVEYNNTSIKQHQTENSESAFQKGIDAGWLSGIVGKVWVKAGTQMMFSSRHLEGMKVMIEECEQNVSVGYCKDAIEFDEVPL